MLESKTVFASLENITRDYGPRIRRYRYDYWDHIETAVTFNYRTEVWRRTSAQFIDPMFSLRILIREQLRADARQKN